MEGRVNRAGGAGVKFNSNPFISTSAQEDNDDILDYTNSDDDAADELDGYDEAMRKTRVARQLLAGLEGQRGTAEYDEAQVQSQSVNLSRCIAEEEEFAQLIEQRRSKDDHRRQAALAQSVPLLPSDAPRPFDSLIEYWEKYAEGIVASTLANTNTRRPNITPSDEPTGLPQKRKRQSSPVHPSHPPPALYHVMLDYHSSAIQYEPALAKMRALWENESDWKPLFDKLTHIEPDEDPSAVLSEIDEAIALCTVNDKSTSIDNPKNPRPQLSMLSHSDVLNLIKSRTVPGDIESGLMSRKQTSESQDLDLDSGENLELEQDLLTKLLGVSTGLDDGIFLVRCQRGCEREIVVRIRTDISSGKVLGPVIRTAFLSLVPGAIYIQATSMSERNIALSNYLREISGLRYSKNSRLPIHELMMGSSLAMTVTQRSLPLKKRFTVGNWVIPRTGAYKGDLGMIVHDTYNKPGCPGDIDSDRQCRLFVIPRLIEKPLESLHSLNKEKQHTNRPFLKLKRPRPMARVLKIHSPQTLSLHYDYKKVIVECIVPGCKSPTCSHPGRRYHMKGVTLLPLSGFALITQSYFNLELATTMPDPTWIIFKEALAGTQDIPGYFTYKPELLPIPSSWSFTAGEEVVTWGVPGLVDGTTASIYETERLHCLIETEAPNVHRVRCSYRRLRKRFELGDNVRLLGDRKAINAGRDGLVCQIEKDYVVVALDVLEDETYHLHPNSLAKVASETRVSYKDLSSGQCVPPQVIPDHETCTGGVPFKFLPVYTLTRHNRRLQPGRIVDVSRCQPSDAPRLRLSGLKVLVEFDHGGYREWFDWDNLRRVSSGRFIQDDGSNPNALSIRSFGQDQHDYFSFQSSYSPAYTKLEQYLLKLIEIPDTPIPQVGMTFASFLTQSTLPDVGGLTPQWTRRENTDHSSTPAWNPGSCTPMHESPATPQWVSGSDTPMHDLPSPGSGTADSTNDHWILSPGIRESLKGMHLRVATVDCAENREVQLLNQDGVTKVVEVSRKNNSVQLGSQIPVAHIRTDICAYALGEAETSPHLFIICRGPHTGKLGRSIKMQRIHELPNTWVPYYLLCLIEVTPPSRGSRNKTYEETFLSSMVRVSSSDLAIVEVTKAQRLRYNNEIKKYR